MNKAAVMFSLGLLLSAAAMPQAQAQLFGPSDEEKAREADQDSKLSDLAGQIQQLQGRVQALEDQARSLTQTLAQSTGTNEELRHQIDLLDQKIDQQQKDFSYRLCMVSAAATGCRPGRPRPELRRRRDRAAGQCRASRGTPAPQPGAPLAPHRRRTRPARPPLPRRYCRAPGAARHVWERCPTDAVAARRWPTSSTRR